MAAPTSPPLPPKRRPEDTPTQGHKPYVPDETRMPEFTWSAVLVGAVLGIIFGASSLYLVLKVGMTVSASIPVAVLSITLFRAFSKAFGFRPATILENNIVQTTGSAGESIAFGIGVTMPAIMLLGFDMTIGRVMVVAVLGGVLGILMMIPLRRAFIVRMHGQLAYPEGTACAQVLISGDRGGASGRYVFIGFFLAFIYKLFTGAALILRETIQTGLTQFNRVAAVSIDLAPELLGVGFIIGIKTASLMLAGALIGNLVIVPAISMFGDAAPTIISTAAKPISQMSLGEIQTNYLRYIGAGCVTAAGIISMFRTMPMIVRSATAGIRGLSGGEAGSGKKRRTERDMPLTYVALGSLALLAVLAGILTLEVPFWAALMGAGLVLGFGFLFATVSSRLTGEIGSSSNPISGMTVATLSLTCLIFLALNMTTPADRVLALSIAAVVCVASSNAGTTSQDLKTGFLVGGTPYLQQWAILIGAITSALVIGGTLLLFNASGTVYSQRNLPSVMLSPDQYNALDQRETYEGREYRVWHVTPGQYPNIAPGKYLVDDMRRPTILVDPAITGRLAQRDDGSEVKMKFDAPKTQVMGIIINGVLSRSLDWGLVLMGAMLAIGIELCGASSLAFAVGVYIPMQYTTPIFLGGFLAWLVGKLRHPKKGMPHEKASLAAEETGPGVLMASGYIAGGSLAGVAIAFIEFAPGLKRAINYQENVSETFVATAWFPSLIFGLLVAVLLFVGRKSSTTGEE